MSSAATKAHTAQAVERLLDALARNDFDAVAIMLDENTRWENVGWPTVRGRNTVLKVLSLLTRFGAKIEVRIHRIAGAGNTVLTERTDAVVLGPLRAEAWVCGTFEVSDYGTITLWRDHFDILNLSLGLLRALLGVVVPALRPAPLNT